MDILVYNHQSDISISKIDVNSIVKEVIKGKKCDEISIHFVNKKEISDLHKKFFDDDSPTDCISFPIDEPGSKNYCVLGDVFVCPRVAIEYAETHGTCPIKEVSLYIIHGTLHLLGYDDLSEREREEMRTQENKHLKNLELFC